MKIAILSIFPEMFEGFLNTSIIGRARTQGLVDVSVTDIRPYSERKHKNTDDYPFGGGAGMVMLAQPIVDAVRDLRARGYAGPCVYMSPRGKPLTQEKVRRLAGEPGMILLCGHYEGVDQRAIDLVVDEEISLGDFVLTGGELPAMALTDAVARYIPGVLGSGESTDEESFSDGLLEYPQYTRPRVFEGVEAPEVLLSGDHARIRKWRREQSLAVTLRMRPDLFEKAELTPKERDAAAQALERMLREEAERKARSGAEAVDAEACGAEMASTETPQACGATCAGSPCAIKNADAAQAESATNAGGSNASENETAPQACGATGAGSPCAVKDADATQACGATGAGSPCAITGADAAQAESAPNAGSPCASENETAPQACGATGAGSLCAITDADAAQADGAPNAGSPNASENETAPQACGATCAGSSSAIKDADAAQADGATNAGGSNASENETAPQACGVTGAGSPCAIKNADAAQAESATNAGSPNASENATPSQADNAASTPQASPAPASSAPNTPTKEDTPTCC